MEKFKIIEGSRLNGIEMSAIEGGASCWAETGFKNYCAANHVTCPDRYFSCSSDTRYLSCGSNYTGPACTEEVECDFEL